MMFWNLFIFTCCLCHCALAKYYIQPAFNPGYILRSPYRLYVDVRYVISDDLIKELKIDEDFLSDFMLNATEFAQKSFAWHNIEMRVVRFDVWKGEDKVKVCHDYKKTLKEFSEYVYADGIVADANLLFIEKKGHGDEWGKSYIGTACSKYAAGLIRVSNTRDYVKVGLTIAHEIGRTLGMKPVLHSRSDCKCAVAGGHCVMKAEQYYWHNSKNAPPFHTCSIQELIANNWPCLNKPMHEPNLFDTCGNGIISEQDGETCDCGTFETCRQSRAGLCCDYSTCQLKPTRQCSDEACCQNCQIISGKLCRKMKDPICDIPEYCDGTKSKCSRDLYVADGKSCGHNAYCFDGFCSDPNMVCKRIFPHEHHVAYSPRCVRMVQKVSTTMDCDNSSTWRNNISANLICSTTGSCSRIWCEFSDSASKFPAVTFPFIVHGEMINCHTKDDQIALTPKGFPCGVSMGCFYGECRPISKFITDCPLCPNGTICNNLGRCHPMSTAS